MLRTRSIRIAALVIALTTVAAACGGGDSSGDGAGIDETTTTTSAPGGSDGTTTSTTEAAPVSGDSSSTWCDRIREFQDSDEESPINFNIFGMTPAQIEAQFETNIAVYEEWARIAPREIDGDVDTVLFAFNVLRERGKAAEWNLLALADDPEFNAAFEDPEFGAAADRIDAYNRDVCGVDFVSAGDSGNQGPPPAGGAGDDPVSILLNTFGIPPGLISEDDIACMREELGAEFEAKITPEYVLTAEDTLLLVEAIDTCEIGLG